MAYDTPPDSKEEGVVIKLRAPCPKVTCSELMVQDFVSSKGLAWPSAVWGSRRSSGFWPNERKVLPPCARTFTSDGV